MDMGLYFNKEDQNIDIELLLNDIKKDNSFRTAVLISWFTDQRVGKERGWWANDVLKDEWGSKLWSVLERGKLTNETRVKAEKYAKDCLLWMVDDGIGKSVDVTISYSQSRLNMVASILKPDGSSENLVYDFIWNEHRLELINGV